MDLRGIGKRREWLDESSRTKITASSIRKGEKTMHESGKKDKGGKEQKKKPKLSQKEKRKLKKEKKLIK